MSRRQWILFLCLSTALVLFPVFLAPLGKYVNWPGQWKFFSSAMLRPYGLYVMESGRPELIRPVPADKTFLLGSIHRTRMEKLFWERVFSRDPRKDDFFCRHYDFPKGKTIIIAPIPWRPAPGAFQC